MHAAPTATSHQDVTAASASPAAPARAKHPKAATSTCRGGAKPGGDQPDQGPPGRSSEPRTPSL